MHPREIILRGLSKSNGQGGKNIAPRKHDFFWLNGQQLRPQNSSPAKVPTLQENCQIIAIIRFFFKFPKWQDFYAWFT
jgi:hypothetical protein